MKIALHGYARAGKDEVGKILMRLQPGMQRVAMGDLIKKQLDPLVRAHLGFSAFTEIDAEKAQIRNVLVHWGYANYKSLLHNLMAKVSTLQHCVNTRIFRVQECRAWSDAGGEVWEVRRPGYGPVEPKEAEELENCKAAGLISRVIDNSWSITVLEDEVFLAWRNTSMKEKYRGT